MAQKLRLLVLAASIATTSGFLSCLPNVTVPTEGCDGAPLRMTSCQHIEGLSLFQISVEEKELLLPLWSYGNLFRNHSQSPMIPQGYIGANMSSCASFAADIGKALCGRLGDNGYPVADSICGIYCKLVAFQRAALRDTCTSAKGLNYCDFYGSDLQGYQQNVLLPSLDASNSSSHTLCAADMLSICDFQGSAPIDYQTWVVEEWPQVGCGLGVVSDSEAPAGIQGDRLNGTCVRGVPVGIDAKCGANLSMDVCQDDPDDIIYGAANRELEMPMFSTTGLFDDRDSDPFFDPSDPTMAAMLYVNEFFNCKLYTCEEYSLCIQENFCNRLGYNVSNASVVCDVYCRHMDFLRDVLPHLCFEAGEEPYCRDNIFEAQLAYDLFSAMDLRFHPTRRKVCQRDMLQLCDWNAPLSGFSPGTPSAYEVWVSRSWAECEEEVEEEDPPAAVTCLPDLSLPIEENCGEKLPLEGCLLAEDAGYVREWATAGEIAIPLFSGYNLWPGRWEAQTWDSYLKAQVDSCDEWSEAIQNLCHDLGNYSAAPASTLCPLYCKHTDFLRERMGGMCFEDANPGYCTGMSTREQLNLDRAHHVDLTRTPSTICYSDMEDICQWNGPIPWEWTLWLNTYWPDCIRCGDGIRSSDEECDDANNANGDGCSAACTVEVGWECAPYSPPSYGYYGDGGKYYGDDGSYYGDDGSYHGDGGSYPGDGGYYEPSEPGSSYADGYKKREDDGEAEEEAVEAMRRSGCAYDFYCALEVPDAMSASMGSYSDDLGLTPSLGYSGGMYAVYADVCAPLDQPGAGQAFVMASMLLDGLFSWEFSEGVQLQFREVFAAVTSIEPSQVLLESWYDRYMRRVIMPSGMDLQFRLLVAASNADAKAAALAQAGQDGTLEWMFGQKGLNLTISLNVTVVNSMDCLGSLRVSVGSDTSGEGSCSGNIELNVCSAPSDAPQLGSDVDGNRLTVKAFSLDLAVGDDKNLTDVVTRVSSCADYAQDIQAQLCQPLGGYNVSSTICDVYCKHMHHLQTTFPALCRVEQSANYCASADAIADPLVNDPWLDLRLQRHRVCPADILQICDWQGQQPPAVFREWVSQEWPDDCYQSQLKCASQMDLPVDEVCEISLEFSFCVEEEAEVGFKSVTSSGAMVMPLFSPDDLFSFSPAAAAAAAESPFGGDDGSSGPDQDTRRADNQTEASASGNDDQSSNGESVSEDAAVSTRVSSCDAFMEDISTNLCRRLGDYNASSTSCDVYCKHLKYLKTITSKLCAEDLSQADQCSRWTSTEQYAQFTGALADARRRTTEICRSDMLTICEWGAGGPPDYYRRWVEEKWPEDCIGRRELQTDGPPPVAVREAEAAATGITVGVAVTVGTVVGASVSSSVAGAIMGSIAASMVGAGGGAGASIAAAGASGMAGMGGVGAGMGGGAGAAGGAGGVGGGASGASGSGSHSSGAGAQLMVAQVQFLAVAGKVGGPGAQPNSSAALSEGLEWSNFHLFSLYGKEDKAEGQRRGGKDGGEDRCEAVRKSSTELTSTVVTCGAVLLGTFVFREIIRALVGCFQRMKGLELPSTFAPFPSWEMYVFVVMYQGLAESAGDAIASRCTPYVIGGIVVLVVLGLLLVLFVWVCIHGLSNNRAYWSHVSLKEGLAKMKEDWHAAKQEPKLWGRLKGKYEAIHVWMVRGEWVEEDHEHKRGVVHSVFVSRFGALFNSFRQGVWWWGLWGMAKVMVIGVVLSNVLNKETNCLIIFILNAAEYVLFIILHPDGYWLDFFKSSYRCVANVAVLGALFAYLSGKLSEGYYTNIFQYISLASILPLILSSLFGALGTFLYFLTKCMSATCSLADAAKVAPDVSYGQGGSTLDEFQKIKRLSQEGDLTGTAIQAGMTVAENGDFEVGGGEEEGGGDGNCGAHRHNEQAAADARARRASAGLESVLTEDLEALHARDHDVSTPLQGSSPVGATLPPIPGSPEIDPSGPPGVVPPLEGEGAATVPVLGVGMQ